MTKSVKKPAANRSSASVAATDADIDVAIARANVREDHRPRVMRAGYRRADDTIVVSLATGVEVAIPRQLLQGLEEATPAQLAQIEIEGPGSGLHWPTLGVDHYVPSLLTGVFGTRQWMADLGRIGGQARTAAKAAASRTNGRRGGRPRKQPSPRHAA